jgi:hypothetical protein
MSHELQFGSRGPDVLILKILLVLQTERSFPNDGKDSFDLALLRVVIAFQTRKFLNAGDLFQMAASTHVEEVRTRTFPGVPQFSANCPLTDPALHISTVSDLSTAISTGNIAHLAYFGHSWNP